jgi:hypothetical protein
VGVGSRRGVGEGSAQARRGSRVITSGALVHGFVPHASTTRGMHPSVPGVVANSYNSSTSSSISAREARPSVSTASAMLSIVIGEISFTSPVNPAGLDDIHLNPVKTSFHKKHREPRAYIGITASTLHSARVKIHVAPHSGTIWVGKMPFEVNILDDHDPAGP